MKIRIPPNARLQNIEAFARNISEENDPALHVELPKTYFAVHPMVLAALLAAGLRAKKAGAVVDFGDIPETKSTRYLERMGLFKQLGIESGIGFEAREEVGRFIPLRVIRSGQQLTDFIVELAPLFHAEDHRRAEPAQYVISELVRNVIEHAGFATPAVVVAQVFPKRNSVGIGVADTGRGVRASLANSHPTPDDLQALQRAMQPGITGKSARPGGTAENAGAGLFFCKSIALSAGTYMVLYSGSGLFKLLQRPQGKDLVLQHDPQNDRATRHRNMPGWPGTIVGTDIDVNAFEQFTGYLEFIRTAYNVDVRAARSSQTKKQARFT